MNREVNGEDEAVIAAIRGGDEAAFVAFARTHQACLLRLARAWVGDAALAADVVQEAWLTMLQSIETFEGRSSLKTWLCGAVINLARAKRRKDGLGAPVLVSADDPADPAVDPGRFSPPSEPWGGHWWPPPSPFPDEPEQRLLNQELRAQLEEAIAQLPEPQRSVVVLRDVEGFSGGEVASILGLADSHQRVLLHRARARLRGLLERHFEGRLR